MAGPNLRTERLGFLKSEQLLRTSVGIGGLVLILLSLYFATKHRSRQILLSNGDVIRVARAPFATAMLSETSCTIVYQPSHGEARKVSLLQDSDSEPAMIIPAADGKSFLCLYYADILYRLFKIYPSELPTAPPKGGYMSAIIISSSCSIEPATIDDWQQLLAYLKSVPANTFDQQSLGYRRKGLIEGVERQIYNIQHGFTGL